MLSLFCSFIYPIPFVYPNKAFGAYPLFKPKLVGLPPNILPSVFVKNALFSGLNKGFSDLGSFLFSVALLVFCSWFNEFLANEIPWPRFPEKIDGPEVVVVFAKLNIGVADDLD